MVGLEPGEDILRRVSQRVCDGLQDCQAERADGTENFGLMFSNKSSSGCVFFNVSRLLDFMDFGLQPYFEIHDLPLDEDLAVSALTELLSGGLSTEQTVALGIKFGYSSRLELANGDTLYDRGIGLLEPFFPCKKRFSVRIPAICGRRRN